jgi:hypothetical protein
MGTAICVDVSRYIVIFTITLCNTKRPAQELSKL